jgi:hypothetical protein
MIGAGKIQTWIRPKIQEKMMLAPIVEIFCDIDDFCKHWLQGANDKMLPNPQRKRQRQCRLSVSEIMTIMLLFHLSHYRTFKDYYRECVEQELRDYFPKLVSYHRFLELELSMIVPLSAYLMSKTGNATGLYYVDSTSLKVCHNRRINRHKTFAGIAERGKTSVGYFFGFKLHLVFNHQGELMSFCLTRGNVDDRQPLSKLFKGLKGLAAGDKGYISKKHEEQLAKQDLRLITKVRRNMKKRALTAFEKYFLSQRSLIETIIDQLKAICQIEHTRHRKPDNFVVNLLAGLAAYVVRPRKPQLKFDKLPGSSLLLTSS